MAVGRKVMILLTSAQFDVLYSVPYRGDDEVVVNMMRRIETLCADIAASTSSTGLIAAVRLLDACLFRELPATELRTLSQTILNKDPQLLRHMPILQDMLMTLYRAVDLSDMLNPSVLSAITRDVVERNKWGRANG